MNEPEPTKRKRGRRPKLRPGYEPHPTPTIKEGASWHVGIPEEEQDELKRRHNEAMEKKMADAWGGPDPVPALVEIEKQNVNQPEPNAVIQIKVEPHRGVLCQVGMVDGDVVHCYSLRPQGHTEYLDVKMGDFVVVATVRTGMVAMRYVKPPEKEQAPNWHEEPSK